MTDVRRGTVAERAARAGGAVAAQAYREDPSFSTKTDGTDLVTEADLDAQRRIVATIAEAYPDDAILAEEEADHRGGAESAKFVDEIPPDGPCWVVDPIDGTTNFVREIDLWASCVACVVDGEPVAAATYRPTADELYAADDDGATLNGVPLSVSDIAAPEASVVAPLGRLFPSSAGRFGATMTAAVERFGDVRRFGSMQLALALVARGGLDAAFMATSPNPWDAVGGALLVRRAGGTVTDLAGDRWTHESDSLVASSGETHAVVREVAATASGG